MKPHWSIVAAVLCVTACTRSPYDGDYRSSTLHELAEHVEWCFKNRRVAVLSRQFYTTGSPPRFVAENNALLSRLNQMEMDVESVDVVDYDDVVPEPQIPGTFENRQLIWIIKPSHWIIVRGKDGELDVKFCFPVVKLGEHWVFPGQKHA